MADISGDISVFKNLSNLVLVSVSYSSKIYGDISCYKNHPKLGCIVHHGTQVSGDIANLSNLKYVDQQDSRSYYSTDPIYSTPSPNNFIAQIGFNNCPNITGDVSSLKNIVNLIWLYVNIFTNLERLGLVYDNTGHNPNLTGNISVFRNLTKLQHIVFNSAPNIYGDVSVFTNCPDINYASMWSTQVSGSFTGFSALTNLANLILGYTQITGTIDDLANTTSLTRIDFASCPTCIGSVNSLSNLTKLTYLDVNTYTNLENIKIYDNTLIYGSIESLRYSNLPNLQYISLGYANVLVPVTGDIGAFANHPNLVSFQCYWTAITGSINGFANCLKLDNLQLGKDSNITGSINSWSNNKVIRYFAINESQNISGSVSSLTNCTSLTQLHVNNIYTNLEMLYIRSISSLYGDISVLSNLTNLICLFALDCPNLTGNISVFNNNRIIKIIGINDFNSKIYGDISVLANCTALSFLQLSYTQVYGNIELLPNFKPFDMTLYQSYFSIIITPLDSLASIYLNNCPNITGDISSLRNQTNLGRLTVNTYTNLEVIETHDALLSGDVVYIINHLPKLNDVSLAVNRFIYGNLDNLNNHNNLVAFLIHTTQVSGNINFVKKLINTTDVSRGHANGAIMIHLHGLSNITGDISAFANSPNVNRWNYIALGNSQVTGDISSLRTCTNLRQLNVNNITNLESLELYYVDSKIYGDISVLINHQKLRAFNISGDSQVTGDIITFANKPNFFNLHIPDNPDLYGDISVFKNSTQLQRLYVQNTQISGSINSLASCTRLVALAVNNITNLEYLDFRFSKMGGNGVNKVLYNSSSTTNFSNCTALATYYFHRTNANFNFEVFATHPNLKGLNVGYTDCYGDISAFKNCTKLTYFDISSQVDWPAQTGMTGDISSLAQPDLQYLKAECCPNLTGDVKAFANCTKLTYLRVNSLTNLEIINFRYGVPITGDISVLINHQKLRSFTINGSFGLYGDISVFANCPNLEQLLFSQNTLYGSINDLANLSKLADLQFISSAMTGSIDSFANNKTIVVLIIPGPDNGSNSISGSVNSLINCTNLRQLHVNSLTNLEMIELNYGNTQFNLNITGNISSLVNCTSLTQFNIGATSVYGDISVFTNMPQLTAFGLNNCPNITGSINELVNHPNLITMGLSYTQVSGDISTLANMPNFLVLYANNSKITGDISSLVGHKKLTYLNVNNLHKPGKDYIITY